MSSSTIRITRWKRICGKPEHNAQVKLENSNSDESETVRISNGPTTASAAYGEVQTKEEAKLYVMDLDLFVTEKLLDNTRTVLSLG